MSACFVRGHKIQLYKLSVPGNGATFLEPYNMQLWENLLEKNGLTLRLMHYQTDIRANYVVCLCGLLVRAPVQWP